MTIIQLKYMLLVAEYKNFTTAANKSFVTQPTLSIQIQKLENSLVHSYEEDDNLQGTLRVHFPELSPLRCTIQSS